MKKLKEYIQATTGLEIHAQPAKHVFLEKLPLFIRKGFRFYEGKLNGRDLAFIFPEGDDIPAPKQLQAQAAKIEDALGMNAVLVLEKIEPYMRNQLTKMRIAFVVTNEQMYIPYMFIALDERKRKKLTHIDHFYPATQTLLIYHLWKKPLNGLNLKEIADHFNYTAMTVTRAVRELEAAELCTTQGGRAKILEFEGTNREIWERAKNFIKNPVKEEVTEVIAGGNGTWILAGINALAFYSALAPGYEKTYAVKKENFKKHTVLNAAAEPGDATVQLWNYDPAVLAKDGVADPFSVYLTLQDDPDERVQMALDEMMEGVL